MRFPKLTLGQMILAGLLIRLALAPIGAHPFDTYVWFDTAQRFAAGQQFYGTTQYSYPPTWAAILGMVDAVYRPLAGALGVRPLGAAQVAGIMGHPVLLAAPVLVDWLFLFLMKLPIIAADLGIAWIVRRIVSSRLHDPEAADRAFAWYFLNPFVIWISAVWGMFDALPTLFTLVGIVLFLDRRDALSGLAFGLAVSLKYFPVLFALAILVAYRERLTRKRVVRFAAGFLLVLGLVSVPFLAADPAAYIQGVLSPTSGAYAGRVTVWEVLGAFGVGSVPLWLATTDILATVCLVGLLTALPNGRAYDAKARVPWVDASLVAVLVFYAVNLAVNPQYFVWVIPFFIFESVVRRETPRLLAITTALVLIYVLTNVEHYSFFLPILTISPSLVGLVVPMPAWPIATYTIGFVVWLLMLDHLIAMVRAGGGLSAIRRVLRNLVAAVRAIVRSPDAAAKPR